MNKGKYSFLLTRGRRRKHVTYFDIWKKCGKSVKVHVRMSAPHDILRYSWWSVWKNLFFRDMPSCHKVPSEQQNPSAQ